MIFICIFAFFTTFAVSAEDVNNDISLGDSEIEVCSEFIPFGEICSRASFIDEDEISELSQLKTLSSLGILQGDGKYFSKDTVYYTAFALRLAYRAAGREQQCLHLSEDKEIRKTYGLTYCDSEPWADGFYIAAFKDKLISLGELNDALKDKGEYAKTSTATCEMLIKWMCILNDVSLDSSVFKKETGISSKIKPFAGGLFNENKFSREEILTLCSDKPLTHYYAAKIFSGFIDNVIENNGIKSFDGKIEKIEYKLLENKYLRNIYIVLNDGTIFNIQNVLNQNDDIFAKNDFAVLNDQKLDTGASLCIDDTVRIYVKNGTIIFIKTLTTAVADTESEKDIEKKDIRILKGNIYMYENSAKMVIFNENLTDIKTGKKIDGLSGVYTYRDANVYYNNKKIDIQSISHNFDGKACFAYLMPDKAYGLKKVYSLIIFD